MNNRIKTAIIFTVGAFLIGGVSYSHARLRKLYNVIDDLKSELNEQTLSSEELSAKVSELETRISSLITKNEELTSTINDLKDQIETLKNNHISDLEAIEELQTKLEELENEIKILEVTWDGKSKDTEWYDSSKDEFEISKGSELAGLASLVADGETFEDKKIELADDIYLGGQEWFPIKSFSGEFDGGGHVINELCAYSCEAEGSTDYSYNGMFKSLTDATISNVIFDSVVLSPYKEYEETQDENGYWNYMGEKGIIAGQTHGDVTITNITLRNSKVTTYNNSVGGIVAEVRDGTTMISNVDIDNSNIFSSFWGSYDTPVGGLVGFVKSGAKVVLDNIVMAGKIDAYNDCSANYQNFQYRYCGMLCSSVEGMTEENYTDIIEATNVTVIFDTWNQFRYCEYESCGKPSYAGDGEYKYARINEIDGSWNSHGKPETHEHSEKEDNHNVLLPFFNVYGYNGAGGIKPKLINTTHIDDHYEDNSSIQGIKIIFLNGSETGLN